MSLRPLVIATVQAALLGALSNVLAQLLAAEGSKGVNWIPVLQFLLFSIISTPPNYLWQEFLESTYPAHPRKNKGSLSVYNTIAKFILDQTIGAVVNTLLFSLFIHALQDAMATAPRVTSLPAAVAYFLRPGAVDVGRVDPLKPTTRIMAARIHRVTLFKLPKPADQQKLIDRYKTLLSTNTRVRNPTYLRTKRSPSTTVHLRSSIPANEMRKTPKQNGKPYILSLVAGVTEDDSRRDGFTVVSKTEFAAMDDMRYYDDECEAHAKLKAFANKELTVEGVLTAFFTPAVEGGAAQ
ncbi:hypothetical protein CDD80_203 [Ophiocordyceps camponoti-rufipedis]|uniref:Stress-response A/B barrel domain-containing protein n=1 Tax=Ophiocordyceps camponoti-rufipedis TaxID=2004952 RepID=A0A2C5XQ05_9HYPO|nr:hypothetical protein CDD80_203 [Ophiocordyceps camponoti-rufipedis]